MSLVGFFDVGGMVATIELASAIFVSGGERLGSIGVGLPDIIIGLVEWRRGFSSVGGA